MPWTPMTDDQIERWVERRTDGIDRAYLGGRITEQEYDLAIAELDRLTEQAFREKGRPV